MSSKALVEVEIPDGWELACERMRPPTPGEYFWMPHFSRPWEAGLPKHHTQPKIIVHQKWTWPSWLQANYIACNRGGYWWASMQEPQLDHTDCWVWSGREEIFCLSNGHVDFTPPPCTDWRQSKRKNPAAPTPSP